ncbi:hypothetical protein G6F46_010857 [Rhizopus delemar]|uniref:Uncharacterized protein n=2 Tax=Rhizopus TaxID=4842 RepID=A0A9P7CK57_9FUNG|nr:hypothetical protein G6F36_016138 [Rhizopus arrhizus]KAG1449342.1 hypothetical protein G6F55_010208 [Rhizopus delemar]KAG1490802.1 hypothetical protein G6F54_010463 [Rhizopus delemar]KAG1519869.1 hypothetical protein G6F52_008205 [Rhizopus delemar]KAG1536423.1 hypothetical protein G6F51_010979 [Rhizopus arrhizus]
MYNEQQQQEKQVKNTTVILPPIQSNNVDNIGQKRTVPWLQEEENNNKIKLSKIEEKQISYNSSGNEVH